MDIDRIYLGDAYELIKKVPDNSVDLIVTSPPYNCGKEYEGKAVPIADYLAVYSGFALELLRVLEEGGSLFWVIGNSVVDDELIPLDAYFYPLFKNAGFKYVDRIIRWYEDGLNAKKKLSGRYETILWFCKASYRFNLDLIRVPQKYPYKKAFKGKNKGKPSCNPKGKNPGNVWKFGALHCNMPGKTKHPAQYPQALCEMLLKMSSRGGIVLDPFIGSGTTAAAAKRLGLHYIGFELNADYQRIAVDRVNGISQKEKKSGYVQGSIFD